MIDTHVHIIDPVGFPYPDSTKGYRPVAGEEGTVESLVKVLDEHCIDRAVLVQPSVYGFDNSALLDTLKKNPKRFRGVVMAPATPGALEVYKNMAGVAGVRLNLTDYNGNSNSNDDLRNLMLRVASAGLVVQLQAKLDDAMILLTGVDDIPVIVDHFALPDLHRRPEELFSFYTKLASRTRTWLKVSGDFRIATDETEALKCAVLRKVVSKFRPDRLIWGSDWPFINVPNKKPTYQLCLELGASLIPDREVSDRSAKVLFGWEDSA